MQTSLESPYSPAFLLADVPAAPTAAPTVVSDLTNGVQISVAYSAVSSNGGSSITSYELQKGSTSLTDFVTISGVEPKSLALSFTVTLKVTRGAYYSFRYRAVNSVGPSDWSPVSIIQAATVPPAPPTPVYKTADSSSVTLTFLTPTDNGGSQILNYYLYRDTGVKTSAIDQLESGYTGGSEYQITGLTANTVYRFALVVKNLYGNSLQSMAVSVQTSTTPKQIAAPTVDWTSSSKTSLYIQWASVSDPTATILGYILSMDDGMGGSFSDIFKGVFEPSIFSYEVTGLTTGLQYRFKVRAAGYNDEGPDSNIASFYACTAPSDFLSPVLVQSTNSTIQIEWTAPLDDGGCSLTGYAVFRDDGSSGSVITEVNSSNDAAVRGNPSLSGMTITSFPSGSEGSAFRVKVTAFNNGGRQADSGIQTFILASVPVTPTDAPVKDSTVTSSSVIKVSYGTTPPFNGNSPILTYSLEMDDGLGGSFSIIVGYTSNSLLTSYTISSNIVKGREYRFRYRVKNSVGWSGYSPIGFVLAANVPSTPPKPTFSSYSSDTLYLTIHPPKDNGGSPLLSYKLYRDTGLSFTSAFSLVATMTPDSLVYSATLSSGSYSVGLTYRFKVFATNIVGSSEYSDEAYISFGDVPPQPTAISALTAVTTRTTIYVEWTQVVSQLPVTGWILNMDDGKLGTMTPIYNGTNRPDLTSYKVGDLTTGLPYRFSVQAVDSNGISIASSTTSIYA